MTYQQQLSFELLHLGCFIGFSLRTKLRSRKSTPKFAPPGIYMASGRPRFTLLQGFFSLIYVLDEKISLLLTTVVALQLPSPPSTDTIKGVASSLMADCSDDSEHARLLKSKVTRVTRIVFPKQQTSEPLNHLGLTLCIVSSALWAFSTRPRNSSVWSQHLAAAHKYNPFFGTRLIYKYSWVQWILSRS